MCPPRVCPDGKQPDGTLGGFFPEHADALSLSAEAVRFAKRWMSLGEDGRIVVSNTIVQEERRMAQQKRTARASSAEPET